MPRSGWAPAHQDWRDKGKKAEDNPEHKKRDEPLGPLLPVQSGKAKHSHGHAGSGKDGVYVLSELKGKD